MKTLYSVFPEHKKSSAGEKYIIEDSLVIKNASELS